MAGRVWKIVRGVLLIVVLAIALLLFAGQAQYGHSSEVSDKASHLNIALVNADEGVTINNAHVNLGRQYADRVGKDSANTWQLVSQGVGNAGLRDGSYQLLVEVPAGFSQKISDVNAVNPESVRVRYTVADTDNAKLRALANTVGSQSVADLNKALVNIYFVSIIDNLSTAQTNVNKLVSNQESSVKGYQTSVIPQVETLQTTIPALRGNMMQTKSTNDTLQTRVDATDAANRSLLQTQSAFDTGFAQTLQDHRARQISDTAFYDAVTSMDPEVLGQQVTIALQQLQEAQDTVNAQLAPVSTPSTSLDNLSSALAKLQQVNNDAASDGQQQTQRTIKVLDAIAKVKAQYKEYIAQQAGLQPNANGEYPAVTLQDFLSISHGTGSNDDLAKYTVLAQQLNAQAQNRLKLIQTSIDNLPFGSSTAVPSDIAGIESDKADITAAVATYNNDFDKSWSLDIAQAGSSSQAVSAESSFSSAAAGSAERERRAGSIEQQYQDCLLLVQQLTPTAGSGSSMISGVNDLLQTPVDAYIESLMQHVIFDHLGVDAANPLVDDAGNAFTVGDFAQQVENGEQSRNAVTQQLDTLMQQYTLLQQAQTDLSSKLSDQLSQFKKVQDSFTALSDAKAQAQQSAARSNESVERSSDALQSLLIESTKTADESGAQVNQAKGTTQQVQDFVSTLNSTAQTGANLEVSANGAKKVFDNDVTRNKDFAQSFAQVLSNTHSNGVPNDTALSFLSSPVQADATSLTGSNKTGETIAPGLLVLYAVSMFMCCVLQRVRVRVRDDIAANTTKTRWHSNGCMLGIVLVSHVVLGVIFAVALAWLLSLTIANSAVYGIMMVACAVFFGVLNGYLTRQFSVAGLAVGVFFLVGESLIMNSTGISSTRFGSTLAICNPINFMTNTISDVLSSTTSVTSIGVLVGLIVLGVGLNLLVFKGPFRSLSNDHMPKLREARV